MYNSAGCCTVYVRVVPTLYRGLLAGPTGRAIRPLRGVGVISARWYVPPLHTASRGWRLAVRPVSVCRLLAAGLLCVVWCVCECCIGLDSHLGAPLARAGRQPLPFTALSGAVSDPTRRSRGPGLDRFTSGFNLSPSCPPSVRSGRGASCRDCRLPRVAM